MGIINLISRHSRLLLHEVTGFDGEVEVGCRRVLPKWRLRAVQIVRDSRHYVRVGLEKEPEVVDAENLLFSLTSPFSNLYFEREQAKQSNGSEVGVAPGLIADNVIGFLSI
jgi:hypothetical protein